MAGRFRARFSLPEQDLRRLADCIVEHARPDEERDVERLLGALTTLVASDHAMPGATIAFSHHRARPRWSSARWPRCGAPTGTTPARAAPAPRPEREDQGVHGRDP